MRETLRRAERDVSIRRFLGYGLSERLPSHATVSYAQCVRFAQSSVFEQLFTQVVRRVARPGCWTGSRLVVDATHVEANAALSSLRGELAAARASASIIEAEPDAAGSPVAARAGVVAAGGAALGADAAARGVERHVRSRRLMLTPSCGTSRGSGRIWCTAPRSPSIPSIG